MNENNEKNAPPDPNTPLKELYSVWGPAEAEVIKTFLESHGIRCLFRGQILQSIYPISLDGLGQIKVFVLEKDYESAKTLLDQMLKPENGDAFEKEEDGE